MPTRLSEAEYARIERPRECPHPDNHYQRSYLDMSDAERLCSSEKIATLVAEARLLTAERDALADALVPFATGYIVADEFATDRQAIETAIQKARAALDRLKEGI